MGKLSAKELVKKLSPETLLKIQNQELNQIEIMHALIKEAFGTTDVLSVFVGTIEREVAAAFDSEQGRERTINDKAFEIKVDALAEYAVPGQGHQFDKLRLHWLHAFCKGAFTTMYAHVAGMSPTDTMKFPNDEILQAGFDRACDEVQIRIIRKCYGGKKKEFWKHCSIYGVPRDVFQSILETLFQKALEKHPYKKIYNCIPELYKIAGQIQNGDHKKTRTCWECCEVVDRHQVCGMCLGAVYCGAACQQKAWKEGHQYSCSAIKKIHENHMKNLDIVKAAHANPDKHESQYGYRPNNRIDYLLLWSPFQCFPTAAGDFRVELLSMKCFYSNLGEVKKGMLWCDRPGVIPDVQSAVLMTINDGRAVMHIVQNGAALSHQYPDFSPTGTIESFERRNSELYSNWSNGKLLNFDLPESTSNCSAAEFLKAYETWEQPPSYIGIFKETANSQAYQMIRDYDKKERFKRLTIKATTKVRKRKSKVHMELRERFRQKASENIEQLRKELEVLGKDLTMKRKNLMHHELKCLFQAELIRQLTIDETIMRELTIDETTNQASRRFDRSWMLIKTSILLCATCVVAKLISRECLSRKSPR